MTPGFWNKKRVFLTGHTGFKGSWMSLWLQNLGAELVGYALAPPSQPSLFEVSGVADGMISLQDDIRNIEHLHDALSQHQPEIVFHMAAQSLVRYGFKHPLETYSTNIMGTVNLLEAVRQTDTVKAVVIITSDKCYQNRESLHSYSETDPMGGYDPYSSSKGCAELVTAAYRQSYFGRGENPVEIASARAGNVIGGGDWAEDRLVPDIIRALSERRTVLIRNPLSIRPWQHVLEPLSGYLLLAERLFSNDSSVAGAWNFGPDDDDARPVQWLVEQLIERWGDGAAWVKDQAQHPHEAHYLKLDCSRAKNQLGWQHRLPLAEALELIVAWHRAHLQGADMRDFSQQQIAGFQHRVAR